MTHRTHSLRYAGTAIAAALALSSTPALAQDPATPFPGAPPPAPVPEIVVPDIPVPATPEPTVVLPAQAPEPAPAPESAAEPAETESTPPAPTARTTRVTAPAERQAPAPEPEAIVASSEPAPLNEPAALPPVAPVAADPLPPRPIEEPVAERAEIDTAILALILGGLAFLALAIWGFIAIGRRKPVRRYAAVAPQPDVREPAKAEPSRAAVNDPVVADIRPARPVSEPQATSSPSAGLLPHAGASVALPRRLPESFAEREALFRQMVDARPDRANPFTDRKARMKRARLIMQSLGRDFGDAEPWIDLSQYPQNWPELAHRRSAAA